MQFHCNLLVLEYIHHFLLHAGDYLSATGSAQLLLLLGLIIHMVGNQATLLLLCIIIDY